MVQAADPRKSDLFWLLRSSGSRGGSRDHAARRRKSWWSPFRTGKARMVPDRLGGATVPTGRAWCSPGGDVMPSRCQRSRVSGVTGEKGSAPWRHQLSEQHEERPIAGGKYRPLDHSRRDDDLLTQQRVLRDELLSGASQVGEQPDDYGCGDGWRPARRSPSARPLDSSRRERVRRTPRAQLPLSAIAPSRSSRREQLPTSTMNAFAPLPTERRSRLRRIRRQRPRRP